jgi:AcrR family transcriptional regulator
VPQRPTPPPLDRRKRKSRAALQRSLLQLIAVKPYDAITIEDVTEAADVARATFYAHYKDKAALLLEACQELIGALSVRAAAVAPQDTATYTGAGVAEVFRHAEEHRDLYRLVLNGEGGAAPRSEMIAAMRATASNVFCELTRRLGREPRVPMDAITAAFVGALLLTIETWLAGDLEGTPADLAVRFVHSQVSGLEWDLGFDEGEFLFRPRPD